MLKHFVDDYPRSQLQELIEYFDLPKSLLNIRFYTPPESFSIKKTKEEDNYMRLITSPRMPGEGENIVAAKPCPHIIQVFMFVYIEEMIRFTLPLLLLQKIPNELLLEIYIISNGSDDKTLALLDITLEKINGYIGKNKKKGNIKFVLHKLQKAGRGNAIRYSRNHAKSNEYPIFIDADVIFHPKTFVTFHRYLWQYKPLSASIEKYPIFNPKNIISLSDSLYIPGKLEHKLYGNIWSINNSKFPDIPNIYRDDYYIEKKTIQMGKEVAIVPTIWFLYFPCTSYKDYVKQLLRRKVGVDEIKKIDSGVARYCLDSSRWVRIGKFKGLVSLYFNQGFLQNIMISLQLILNMFVVLTKSKDVLKNPEQKLTSTNIEN